MSGMIPTWAQSAAADDIAQLQKEMYQLYNKNDETAFVDITNKLKEAAQKANDERTFYKAWSNQALYFANHQQRNKGQLIASVFTSSVWRYSVGVTPYSALKFIVKLFTVVKPTA